MTLLKSIEKDFAVINKAAADFLPKLSGTDIKKDIVLSAELAGLMLLRASNVDFLELDSGNVVLGAVADETYKQIQRFIYGWSQSNGLDPREVGKEEIPDDYKEYIPAITQLEQPFYEICKQNNIGAEYYPFVAVLSALKLVLAGRNLKLLDPKTGLAMVFYHIISGSKTVPYKN